MRAMVLALVLAACSPPSPPEPTAEPADLAGGGMDLHGPLIAVGADFRLDALPDENLVALVFPGADQTYSGPYAPPQATETGAQLQTGAITLTLTPGACTHEGVTYPMRAHVELASTRSADGCAVVRWDAHLLALMPQIDACIAQSPETRWVTYAADTGEALVTVRLQGVGPSVDCTVPNDDADPRHATIAPRREDFRPPGDNEALFVRGEGGENPGGECYEAPEVRGANGELLGWMMDPLGC